MRMKRYRITYNILLILSPLFVIMMSSCNEDKGNYTYHELPKVEVGDMSKTDTITFDPSERFYYEPEITYIDGSNGDKGSYSYEWAFLNGNKIEIFFSKSHILDVEFSELPEKMRRQGNHVVYFKIVEQETAMTYYKKYVFNIKSKLQAGYLAISEKKSRIELDMIASFTVNGKEELTFYPNILELSNSTYPNKDGRKPIGISLFHDNLAPSPEDTTKNKVLYSTFLLTDKSSDRLNAFDYSFKEDTFNISNISFIVPEYKPELLIADKMRYVALNAQSSQFYASIGNNWYFASRSISAFHFIYPLNRLPGELKPYKVSPYIGVCNSSAILFNEDRNCFMLHSYSTSDLMNLNDKLWTTSLITDVEGDAFRFNNKDYELIYMDTKKSEVSNSDIFAIVRNRSTTNYELLLFSLQSTSVKDKSKIRRDIPNGVVDIPSVKHYAFNPSEPIFYMATEDKIYVALASGSNMSIKDITSSVVPSGHKISCVKAVKTYKRSLRNLLYVATYDPSADLDTCGTLQFFEMNPTSGNLTLAKHPASGENQISMKWSGLGKVVDIDYKEK